MPITSGSIEYERRLPKDDANTWNYKHVVAKVSWTVEPGEDDDVLAAYATDKVVMRVKAVLNWKPPVPDDMLVLATEIDLENKAAPNLAAQHPVAEITAGIPPTLKRHRRTKAEMEAARAADPTLPPTLPEPSEEAGSPTSEPGRTKAEMDAARAALRSRGDDPAEPSFDPDPIFEPPAEVTDQALLDACQAKASSGKPVADIKELVAKFSPGGLVQTPQDARRRFLDDLAKL